MPDYPIFTHLIARPPRNMTRVHEMMRRPCRLASIIRRPVNLGMGRFGRYSSNSSGNFNNSRQRPKSGSGSVILASTLSVATAGLAALTILQHTPQDSQTVANGSTYASRTAMEKVSSSKLTLYFMLSILN